MAPGGRCSSPIPPVVEGHRVEGRGKPVDEEAGLLDAGARPGQEQAGAAPGPFARSRCRSPGGVDGHGADHQSGTPSRPPLLTPDRHRRHWGHAQRLRPCDHRGTPTWTRPVLRPARLRGDGRHRGFGRAHVRLHGNPRLGSGPRHSPSWPGSPPTRRSNSSASTTRCYRTHPMPVSWPVWATTTCASPSTTSTPPWALSRPRASRREPGHGVP